MRLAFTLPRTGKVISFEAPLHLSPVADRMTAEEYVAANRALDEKLESGNQRSTRT
jgi:hypothetical protein